MKRRSVLTIAAVVAASTMSLAGCSAPASNTTSTTQVSAAAITKALNTPTTLTFWSWVPQIQNQVALFEKKYPKIQVKLVNAGQGGDEYKKLNATIAAGKGAPDVVQLEYSEIPSYLLKNSLADLTPYGAAKLESQFAPAAWKSVETAGKVYGIPQDLGPMIVMYRKDILAKAGVSVPQTWADFATAAATVKAKTGASLIDLAPGGSSQILGMLQQIGAKPFSYDGKKTISVDLTNAKSKQVADYLTALIKSGNISDDPDWNNDWFSAVSKGKYAGWLVGAWGPDNLTGTAANTSGKWVAARMPQWTAGSPAVAGNWGGSSDVVTSQSANKIAAYELAKFINSDPTSTHALTFDPKQALFPATQSILKSSAYTDETSAFFGGQKVQALYAQIADEVNQDYQSLPISDYVGTAFTDTVSKAITNKTDMYTAFAAWQAEIVKYAKSQGFTVK